MVSLGREEAAKLIRDDGIDILIDMAGHTDWSGLPIFGHKPAPVQASWLGFFATTGCRAIDYFIGDAHTLPADEVHHFTERPWRLPDSYLCFTPPPYDVAVGPLPMVAHGGVTFGCFGKLVKISDEVVALWSRILHALPDARLLLKAHGNRRRRREPGDARPLRAAWHRRGSADSRRRVAACGILCRV